MWGVNKTMVIATEWSLLIVTCIFIISILCIGFHIESHEIHKISFKKACLISAGWILSALIFNIFLWCYLKTKFNYTIANQKALEFFAGYFIEKSLSLDNVFVFALIFKYFAIPKDYQRIVLSYGIISAILLRLILILAGICLITKFHWILRIFGALLIISGGKILISFNKKINPIMELKDNFIINLCNKYLRTTKEFHKEKFFLKRHGKLFITPLFLAMVLIEISDIVFSTDSIPAIFSITEDPFIIITSNIFAILGLRSLYFLLATGLRKFNLLNLGLAIILMFIGVKMLLMLKLSIITTLSSIAIILIICILLSVIKTQKL